MALGRAVALKAGVAFQGMIVRFASSTSTACEERPSRAFQGISKKVRCHETITPETLSRNTWTTVYAIASCQSARRTTPIYATSCDKDSGVSRRFRPPPLCWPLRERCAPARFGLPLILRLVVNARNSIRRAQLSSATRCGRGIGVHGEQNRGSYRVVGDVCWPNAVGRTRRAEPGFTPHPGTGDPEKTAEPSQAARRS